VIVLGSRVVFKGYYVGAPGTVVGLRRSDDLYASGKRRSRGTLYAVVKWDDTGGERGYPLSELRDLDDEDDE